MTLAPWGHERQQIVVLLPPNSHSYAFCSSVFPPDDGRLRIRKPEESRWPLYCIGQSLDRLVSLTPFSSAIELSQKEAPRQKLPYDPAGEIDDAPEKGEEVEEVSVGVNGDWFLLSSDHNMTDQRNGTSALTHQPRVPSVLG